MIREHSIGLRFFGISLGSAALSLALSLTASLQVSNAQEIEPPAGIRTIDEVGEYIDLIVDRSEVFWVPRGFMRVAIGAPGIADVSTFDRLESDGLAHQILVLGNNVGITNIIVWDEGGQNVWTAKIRVLVDLEGVAEDLRQLFPEYPPQAVLSGSTYIVKGSLRRADDVAILASYFESKGITYVNMTSVEGVQQVQIKVRIAEVNRTAVRDMAVSLLSSGGSGVFAASNLGPTPVNIGMPGGLPVGASLPFQFLSAVSANPLVTLLVGFPRSDLEFFFRALEENQYLRILAEPTLIALSGSTASFLAGGEFPIPVVQDGGGGGSGGSSITIEFKEFGIRLQATPLVLGNGRIRLHVAPEVSELSDSGAVTVGGLRVPSLITRRSETTIEMNSGETFAISGLYNQTTNTRRSQVPLLGDVPILGQLFRSTSYINGESELVVLVTASLVEPLSHGNSRPVPGDLYVPPNDWNFFVEGKTEGSLRRIAHPDGIRLRLDGLKDLRGPGAWATYDPD